MRAYIDEKLEEIRSEKVADAREVMEYLTAVMRGEHTEQVLRLVGNGAQRVDTMSVTEKDRLKAAELIGKRYGLFKENVDVKGAMPVVILDDVKE
jgi:phage terminase small subunit